MNRPEQSAGNGPRPAAAPQRPHPGPATQMAFARYHDECLRQPRNQEAGRLLRYGARVFSQNDEDGILQEILNRVGSESRRFVEFGVEDGRQCNTRYLLETGWSGLWIEAQQRYVQAMQLANVQHLSSGRLRLVHGFVTAESINAMIHEALGEVPVDVLSIDIDMNDYWIWRAIDGIAPRVVVIEYNAALRPPASLVVPYDPARTWDGTNYFGASLKALERLGREKGYALVGCCFSGVNAFFVREDLVADRFCEPFTAENHFVPPRYFMWYPAGHPAGVGPYVEVGPP